MTCHRLSQVLYTGCPMLPADGMCKTIDNSLRYRKINAGTWWTSYWVPPVVKDMTLRWKLIRRTFHVSPVLSHAIMIHSLHSLHSSFTPASSSLSEGNEEWVTVPRGKWKRWEREPRDRSMRGNEPPHFDNFIHIDSLSTEAVHS